METNKALKIIYELIIYAEEQSNKIYETEDFSDCWDAYKHLKSKIKV